MDDQDEVLAFLADGARHGVRGRRVERIDTPSAVVFLVGDRAFKLLRASGELATAARREAACRALHDANRAIAPALYRGVRTVRRRGGQLELDGDGEIVDHVVEMRRFDAAARLDRCAAAGRLTAAMARDLADAIAALHDAAPRADADVAALPAGTDPEIDALLRAALARAAPLLKGRGRRGKVRQCHGELDLGHVCLVDGKPVPFDASAHGATHDVLHDVACVLVDLLRRGLGGFANLMLNRYLDLRRDDEGLAVLPLFLARRAASCGDLALARALLQPPPPRLVAIGGASGSGKSTLAQTIAADLAPAPGARVLRGEVMHKALLDLPPQARLPAGTHSHAMAKQVHAALQREAARALDAGRSVILDATFLAPEERAAAKLLAATSGVAFTGIWLDARRPVLAARLAQRRGDASETTIAMLEQQLGTDIGAIDWTRIDSSGAPSRVAAALRRAVIDEDLSPLPALSQARGARGAL